MEQMFPSMRLPGFEKISESAGITPGSKDHIPLCGSRGIEGPALTIKHLSQESACPIK
jgi:hypothetical protein